MERLLKQLKQRSVIIVNMILMIFLNTIFIYAVDKQWVTGKLNDARNNHPIPYANVVIVKASDPDLNRGTISDTSGLFKIGPVTEGEYRLIVSSIGYKRIIKNISIKNQEETDAGIILLTDTSILFQEMVITGDRPMAKQETGRISYQLTKKMLDVSNTGIDVLRLIPGVSIDLMQNISLEGSRNILIFVDGKERDRSYLSQLNPAQIEKVEIISNPPSNYDAGITGVINIILKKERDSGINGQFVLEIPTSGSEMYLFPTFSVNYGFRKLNLYTSYNGEVTYLNITESTNRMKWDNSDTTVILSNQYVRQKNWSHKFHYGFDYFLSSRDLINFYAFFNPYSREFDGHAETQISGEKNDHWRSLKEDTDNNKGAFYSLYYKHIFNKKGNEITFDLSNYSMISENSTGFINGDKENREILWTNTINTKQNARSIKIDHTAPIGNRININSGIKAKSQMLYDLNSRDFSYNEEVLAAYGSFSWKQTKYDFNIGLRAEKSISELKHSFCNTEIFLLPYSGFRYRINSMQNLQLSLSRSVNRPDLYQLNPHASLNDPYSLQKGNPLLKPEPRDKIFLEYSIRFKSNYLSSRMFYYKSYNVINNLMFINDTGVFEIQVHNMGTISQFGNQFTAALKLGSATLNPWLRVFHMSTTGNELAKKYLIKTKDGFAFESGLSAIIPLKNNLAFSLTYQYSSPKCNIQNKTYSDALYFLSLDKTFKKKYKLSIASALPFTKSFIYQASDIEAPDFYSHYKGQVKLSSLPVWIKFSCQFNSGKNREKINRVKEEISNGPKKGF